MGPIERRIRILAGATVATSFALPVLLAVGFSGGIVENWILLILWIFLVSIIVRPLLRRMRGASPLMIAPSDPNGPRTPSEAALAPWLLITAPNALLAVYVVPRWKTAYGKIGLALVIAAFVCAAIGKRLEASVHRESKSDAIGP
jgi:hypothetical protein